MTQQATQPWNVEAMLKTVKLLTGDNIGKTEEAVSKTSTTLYDIIMRVANDAALATTTKRYRPIISQSTLHVRPKQLLEEYLSWSGWQPIDVDFHCAELVQVIKSILKPMLERYPWFVSIASSTSGNGLHIYTVNKPFEFDRSQLYVQKEVMQQAKDYYLDCYEAKSLVVWKALVMCSEQLEAMGMHDLATQAHPIANTASRRQNKDGSWSEANVLDSSVCKISQTLFITYDPAITINKNCQLVELPKFDVSLYNAGDQRFQLQILKDKFDRLRGRFAHKAKTHDEVMTDGEQTFAQRDDVAVTQEGTMATIQPQNYDNTMRYRMAYTLAWLYDLQSAHTGEYEKVLQMYLYMCSGNPKYDREHMSWAKTFASAVERNAAGTAPCVWSAIKELREKHGFKISVKNRSAIVVNEIIAEHNTEDKVAEYIMSTLPAQKDFELKVSHEFNLAPDEYLSTYKQQLEDVFVIGLNYLIARPGSGKTEFIKSLTKDGKRILLVEPYTSILQSKIETSDLGFYCVYGNKSLELSKHLNIAMTFDKFTLIDAEEASILFDYIVIDESHLLTMSAYRDTVPADCLDKCKQLQTKVVLMTGTPVAEHMFVNFSTITRCNKPLNYNKLVRFVCCKHDGDKITKIASHIVKSLSTGKKILFPTNKGDVFMHAIVGAVRMMLGRNPRVKYYKKDNALHDFVQTINEQGTLGEVEILFCTNYLSVGIDINDTCEFDVIYDEAFTAQEIEQFNSRLRKIAIQSYVYFSMQKSNGDPKNLTAYDELDLTLTAIEQLTFWDVLQMQTKRNDSRSLYDFFEWAFNAPWFYKDIYTGEIKVHLTAYKLNVFEEKWREWSAQLVVIQNVLHGYGYECKVVNDVVADDAMIEATLNAAKEARKEYRAEKNNKIAKMFASFVNQSTFDIIMNLSSDNVIEGDHFELLKKRGRSEFVYMVEDKRIFEEWKHSLKTLSRFYVFDTIMRQVIDPYVIDDKDMYRLARIKSVKDAVSIFDAALNNSMHDSNIKIVTYMLNDVFNNDKQAIKIASEVIDQIVHNSAIMYFDTRGYMPQSPDVIGSVESIARRLFNAITVHEGDIYAIKQLPPFDSGYSRSRNALSDMLHVLFADNDIFASKTDQLLQNAKLQSSISQLVFDNVKQSDNGVASIVSLKRIDAANDEAALQHLNEIDDNEVDAQKLQNAFEHHKVVRQQTQTYQSINNDLEALAAELLKQQ